jgi:hypothetical protein
MGIGLGGGTQVGVGKGGMNNTSLCFTGAFDGARDFDVQGLVQSGDAGEEQREGCGEGEAHVGDYFLAVVGLLSFVVLWTFNRRQDLDQLDGEQLSQDSGTWTQ